LSYLIEHPDSSDTLEGIAQWWLLEQRIKPRIAMVKEAVDELVGMGLILQCQTQSSQIYYRVNPRSNEKIKKILKERSW
jgi:predicted transcriptional regulator